MAATIEKILTRGVEQILPDKKDLAALMQRRKIRLYSGIDPTNPHLHLGHSVVLRKLREFQELGHETILLIGSFTAQIGDPTDKEAARKPLTPEQVQRNMATYKAQASKILNFSRVRLVYNADWLLNLGIEEIIELLSHVTAQQMIKRDMFQKRLKAGKLLHLHEFFYPVLQGYDSVHLNVDLEVAGTDQLFNMLIGRKLQKIYNNKEKFILTVPLLPGLDGQKMSKSLGNTVNLTDPPRDMYGKLMSLKDELMIQYFELCTDLPMEEIKKLEKEAKVDPMGVKKRLAREITKMYHGTEMADEAQREFERTVQKQKLPTSIPPVKIIEKELPPTELLVRCKLAKSKSEARRLIEQGGVTVDGEKLANSNQRLAITDGAIIKVGKRRFVKISH